MFIAYNYFDVKYYLKNDRFDIPLGVALYLPIGLVLLSLINVNSHYKYFVLMYGTNQMSRLKQVGLGFAIIIIPIFLLPISVISSIPLFFFACSVIIFSYNLTLHDKSVNIDFLTGLNNRTQLMRFLTRLFSKKPSLSSSWHLYFFDVDKFKSINDSFGHEYGDKALLAIAKCLKLSATRRHCFICRYAGDEFVVVIREDNDSSFKIRFTSFLDELNYKQGFPFNLSVSIGLVEYQDDLANPMDFIEAADADMYEQQKRNHLKH